MKDIYNDDECCELTSNIDRFYSVEDYATYMITNNNGIIDSNDIPNLSKFLWYERKLYLIMIDDKVRRLIRYMLMYQYQHQNVEEAQYIAIHLTQILTDLSLVYEGSYYDNNHTLFWNCGLSDIFNQNNYQKIYLVERKILKLEDVSPAELPYDIDDIIDHGIYTLFAFLKDNAETDYTRKLLDRILKYKDLFAVTTKIFV